MVKLIAIMKRKDGLTYEEFSRYWYEKHGPLAAKAIPGLRKYVQNHAVKLPGRGEPPIDGVAELWFDDLESFQAMTGWRMSDEGKILLDDEKSFMNMSKVIAFVAEERVIKES